MWLIALLLILVAVMVAAYKSRQTTSSVITGLTGISYFEDFFETTTGTPYISETIDVGEVVGSIAPPSEPWRTTLCGVGLFNTGTGLATSGRALIELRHSVYVGKPTGYGGMVNTVSTEMFLPNLSTATSTFSFLFGIFDSGVSPSAHLCNFVYDKSVSDNWICRTKTDSGTNNVITDIPVVANEFIRLKVITSANTAYYYIDNVVVATVPAVTTNSTGYIGALTDIAVSPTNFPPSVGAALDYIWYTTSPPIPRPAP